MDLNKYLHLSLEQKLELEKMKRSTSRLTLNEAKDLLIQSAKLIIIKDNIIRGLLKDNERI